MPPLTGTILEEIWELDSLMDLDLGNNNQICGHLPSTIGHLTSLIKLNLYANRIDGTLLAELGKLHALTLLRLGYNNFTIPVPNFWDQVAV